MGAWLSLRAHGDGPGDNIASRNMVVRGHVRCTWWRPVVLALLCSIRGSPALPLLTGSTPMPNQDA